MEKLLNEDERIRRAEEIYYRRKNGNADILRNQEMRESPKKAPLKRMIIQIFFCLIVYLIFYTVQNSNYIFSKEFLDNVNQVIYYDLDVKGKYEYFVQQLQKYFNKENLEETDNTNKNAEIMNTIEETLSATDTEMNYDEGFEEDIVDAVSEENNDLNDMSEMEIDAKEIKSKYDIDKPINGVITSLFGNRQSEHKNVSGYHTGIDIAMPTGTVISSASDGTVQSVSSIGDYGKHLKIAIDDVIFLYAHCSKIYVNEGDVIKKGQSIAEVGSTREYYWPTFAL